VGVQLSGGSAKWGFSLAGVQLSEGSDSEGSGFRIVPVLKVTIMVFGLEEVDSLLSGAGMVRQQLHVDRRLQVNRGKQLKMYRVWIQAKYRKLGVNPSTEDTATRPPTLGTEGVNPSTPETESVNPAPETGINPPAPGTEGVKPPAPEATVGPTTSSNTEETAATHQLTVPNQTASSYCGDNQK
jgi:hypothetical protein